jgi:hypothetical protein
MEASQSMSSKIFVKEGDIVEFSCDVLVLKFAQSFYGTDALVARLLSPNTSKDISPPPGKHVLLPSKGKIAAKNVLFVGVVQLYQFDYEQIRKLAKESLRMLTKEMPNAAHVAMTMHGVGYGLDEKEAFLAQIGGLFDAFSKGTVPLPLKRVTIVERDRDRALRLKRILKESLPSEPSAKTQKMLWKSPPKKIVSAGAQSKNKPHVFVAMPFSKQMVDVYRFGILEPINSAKFLCERVDMEAFTGDILTRIKSRIETASLVIADLTGASANVYLEVGYAWGKDRPTLFLAQKSDELKFDVQGQKCIIYETISELKDKLEKELAALKLGSIKA